MQIISGKFRGRKLALPANARPTQNRARIALFNILNSTLKTKASAPLAVTGQNSKLTVWDAFAGSGAFGIEFLSRNWAEHVIFTDSDAGAIKTINRNLDGFCPCEFTVRQTDAIAAAAEFAGRADIVFVDPPYAKATGGRPPYDNPDLGEKFISELATHAKPGTIIVWEREKVTSNQEPVTSNFEIIKDKTYGRARFIIMQKKLVPDYWLPANKVSKNDTAKTL